MPVRIVLDTNIIISGLLSPLGNESRALRLILSGAFQVCVSEAILGEYRDVLSRLKFQALPKFAVNSLLDRMARGMMVQPRTPLSICHDPDDNRFLECAEAAEADYLITGNLRHFPAEWKKTKIVNARQFFETIQP